MHLHRDRRRQSPRGSDVAPEGWRRDPGSLVSDATTLVAVRDWTFVLGPGFIVGIGNGLILGYLMYTSGLVPRGLAMLGLIGGPLICISGLAVVLDVIDKGGAAQGIATAPEFLWELSLGIYPIVKGFKVSPILEAGVPTPRTEGPPSRRPA